MLTNVCAMYSLLNFVNTFIRQVLMITDRKFDVRKVKGVTRMKIFLFENSRTKITAIEQFLD